MVASVEDRPKNLFRNLLVDDDPICKEAAEKVQEQMTQLQKETDEEKR